MRTFIIIPIISMLAAIPVLSQHIEYMASSDEETGLISALTDTSDVDNISAELTDSTITVRVPGELSASRVIEIAEVTARFYGAAVFELRGPDLQVLWSQARIRDNAYYYRHGITFDRSVLHLIDGVSDAIRVIRSFVTGVSVVVPDDEYDEGGDNERGGASSTFGDVHTLTAGDRDWFVYTVQKSGEYLIETRRVIPFPWVDTEIDVFTDGYLEQDDDGGDGLYSKVSVCAEIGTKIFVEVSAYRNKAGYYILDVSDAGSNICRVEEDEADERDNAEVFSISSVKRGSVYSSSDIDWFELKGIERGSTYDIRVTSAGSNVYGVLEVHGAFRPVKSIQIDGGKRVSFSLQSRGSLFLKIAGERPSAYNVSVLGYKLHEL